jgi:multidrug efflux system membrane fusion protein
VRKSILDGVEKDFKGTVRVTIAGLLPEKADAELKTWLQTKAEGQDPKMALALMRDLFGLDTSKLLKEAKVPVRCINSAGGYKFFTPTAVETNKKYADFGAVTIDGVGHHPMLEKPDEFNRKLRDVLKELRPRSEPASPGTGAGRRTFVVLRSCLLVTLGVVGCQQKPALQALPPPTVVVAKPVNKQIVEWQYFTAQTRAVDTVTITPRVTGYIDNISFKEGDVVDVGDLLYVIDPRPYQAALDQAKGQVEQALAQQKLDNANLERSKDLLAKKVIAQQDFDTTASQKYVADAQVVASQAAVESAQLNLDFTHIRSPIHGRISAQLVSRGNLVQANSTQLTTIVSIDPIYAYFNVDEASVIRFQKAIEAGQFVGPRQATLPIWLQLDTEIGYPHQGVIDFVDNSFDPSTSTLRLRGRFPNQQGYYLIPGAFGTIRMAGSPKYEGILVADRAIGSDQDQKYVMIVQPDGLTKYQRVELGPIVDGLRVVRSGLKGDETVIVEGIGKVRPNFKVNAEQTDMNKYATDQLAMETHIGQEPVDQLAATKAVPSRAH